jgi:hypothetical protein
MCVVSGLDIMYDDRREASLTVLSSLHHEDRHVLYPQLDVEFNLSIHHTRQQSAVCVVRSRFQTGRRQRPPDEDGVS